MLGSNPSADSGAKTETGSFIDPASSLLSLRFGTCALNPGGLGLAPRKKMPTTNSEFPLIQGGELLRFNTLRCLKYVNALTMIETVAINQLEARRERLVTQQTEARFGVADSYDRASRAESGTEER